MPEGDTIFRAATTLRKALLGRIVQRFDTSLDAVTQVNARTPATSRTVAAVEPHGKHLLIVLRRTDSDGPGEPIPAPDALGLELCRYDLVLHTHLRMTGSWHIYRPGEPWNKPVSYARVVLHAGHQTFPCPKAAKDSLLSGDFFPSRFGRGGEERAGVGSDAFIAVCFSAPVVELLTAREAVRHPQLSTRGPDAMTDAFDAVAACDRLRRRADLPIGVAIMDQHAMAGVGNVYKSEVLFLERVSPFTPVSSLDDGALDSLVHASHKLLRANETCGDRRTNFVLNEHDRLWVYGRSGSPCRVCGSVVKMRRQGIDGRSTYYCPTCQGVA